MLWAGFLLFGSKISSDFATSRSVQPVGFATKARTFSLSLCAKSNQNNTAQLPSANYCSVGFAKPEELATVHCSDSVTVDLAKILNWYLGQQNVTTPSRSGGQGNRLQELCFVGPFECNLPLLCRWHFSFQR